MKIDKRNFSTKVSPTQYNLYKYKIKDIVIHGKKKNYRYKVGDTIYSLVLSKYNYFRYILVSHLSNDSWKYFIKNKESYITSLGLLTVVIEHLIGIIEFNRFSKVILPEDLEDIDDIENAIIKSSINNQKKNNNITLKVFWFSDDMSEDDLKNNKSDELKLVIFHNEK